MNMKVSIIIPTYKRDINIVSEAISSVLKQTYTNIEIVVVDDNAAEDLESFRSEIKKYIDSINDDRIIYIANSKNLGSAKTRNAGIEASTGEYITFLDDDDVYLENKVINQLNDMLNNDADYSISDIALYYRDDKLAEYRKRDYIESYEKNMLLKYHIIHCMAGTDSMMFKREYLLKIGCFNSKDFGDDFYLFENAILNDGKFTYLNRCDFKAYVHVNDKGLSIGASKINGENETFNHKKQYFNLLTKKERRIVKVRHYLVLAYAYYREKKIFKCLSNIIKSLFVDFIQAFKIYFAVKKGNKKNEKI